MKKIIPFLLLVSLIPIANATPFQDMREYEIWVGQSTSTTGAVGTTTYTLPALPYGYARTQLQAFWIISATYTAPSGPPAGTQTFQFVSDGTNVAGCTWSLTRTTLGIGVGIMTGESHFFIRCLQPLTYTPGSHTYAVTIGGTIVVAASRTDFTIKFLDRITDDTLDKLQTNVNANTNITRVNVNSNTNSTGLINRININSNTNTTSDELSNGTWSRWDYSSNRVHLRQINNPPSVLDITTSDSIGRIFDKYGYGYFFAGDDTDLTNDAQDYGLYSDRRQSLAHYGNITLFTSFTPQKRTPSESGLMGAMIANYESGAPNTYWKIRIQNGASQSTCDNDEDLWRIAYSHGSTNIFGTECFPYDEQYTFTLTRDVTTNTVEWVVNGNTDGPFTYTTDPSTSFDGMIVIGSCGPSGTGTDCVDATSASAGVTSSKDYRGIVQELRVWDHIISDENLTQLADPLDDTFKFCTEGTENVLYHLEPYLVQPLQNCIERANIFITTNNNVFEGGMNVTYTNQTFNATVYLNQTLSGNITQNYFNTTTEGNLTRILQAETSVIANSLDAFFWLALITLSVIVPRHLPNKIAGMAVAALLAGFAIFWGFQTFPESGFKSISFFIGFAALVFSIVLVNNENRKRRMQRGDDY